MRAINKIIIHCSATKEGKDFDAADITRWHKARKYRTIGYHYVIKLDGTIEKGRPDKEVGAHAKGYNSDSIGICYIGGLDSSGKAKDTRTDKQIGSMLLILDTLKKSHKDADIIGHNEVSSKACPCFNVQKWLKTTEL